MTVGVHDGAPAQPARKAVGPQDGSAMVLGPSGSGSVVGPRTLASQSGWRLSEIEVGEIAQLRRRDDKQDRWQNSQGVDHERSPHMHRISVEARGRLPGVSEGVDIHRDLLDGRNPARSRSARSLKQCAMDEEQRCVHVLEKVRAMRSQLGEDLKRNNTALGALQMSRDGTCISSDAEAFCQTLLSSFAKEPEIPKDLEVMIKDCFKSCIGVHNKECMACMRDFTAKDLLTCKTSNRCRHSLYPCGHSVLCGDCAEILWRTTKKCPMCRSLMTKRPKVFKPGRWQMVGPCKE